MKYVKKCQITEKDRKYHDFWWGNLQFYMNNLLFYIIFQVHHLPEKFCFYQDFFYSVQSTIHMDTQMSLLNI